jgi:glutamine synthetase
MAADYNINITKGSTFTARLVAQDASGNIIDLTNWSLRGYAKIKYSDVTLLVDLNPAKVAPFTSGFIDIIISAAATATLPVTEGVYDIEMYDSGGYVDKLMRGYVRVYPEVTY